MENTVPVTRYTTKQTAQFIREALKAAFPGVKFSVRMPYGNKTLVSWTDGPTVAEVERVTNQFTSQGFDSMTDCPTYHSQVNAKGEAVRYSGWVSHSRHISAALLTKALNRYNQERALYGHGPAALEVKASAYSAYLVGADVNTANPCNAVAGQYWCESAVQYFASVMRPNGIIVKIKPVYS